LPSVILVDSPPYALKGSSDFLVRNDKLLIALHAGAYSSAFGANVTGMPNNINAFRIAG
jgi:hypothetical protein